MVMENIKLAIFDMDGLLLDTERLALRIALETAERLGYPLTEENVLQTVGMTWEGTFNFYKNIYPAVDGLEKYASESKRAYDEAIKHGEIPVKSGCRELLRYLKKKKVRCVVATSNSRARAELCLKKAGLSENFERVFCGEEVENGKPSPDIFLLACREAHINPQETIVFEDSINGLLAARAGDMRCILIPDIIQPTLKQKQLATVCLRSLEEVFTKEIL